MTKVAWNISIDKDVKDYIKAQAEKEGLKPSQYIQLLARSSRAQRGPLLDFDLIHTDEDEKDFQIAMKELENGETTSQEEMIAILESKGICTK